MKLNTPVSVTKPEDPVLTAVKEARSASAASSAAVVAAVKEMGTNLAKAVADAALLNVRASDAVRQAVTEGMQKRPFKFTVQRGADGLIESVVARPE